MRVERCLTVLESTAEEYSSRTGTRSPTDQPILTSDACRAMINTSAGGGIYQALRRLLRSSFTDRQSVADWFWFGVMDAQYDGLVSGDADRGKQVRSLTHSNLIAHTEKLEFSILFFLFSTLDTGNDLSILTLV